MMSYTLSVFLVLVMHFTEISPSQGPEIISSSGTVVETVVSYGGVLMAVSVVICVVLILIGCADLRGFCASLCPQRSTFRDFDDGYFNDISISAAPPMQFSMYPPVESTPESRYAGGSSVYFEPLPDLAARRHNQGATANFLRLRPKISQVGFDRMDSDDWEEVEGGQPNSDRPQELAKLEKLVTNSRNQFPRTQLQYIKEMGSGWFGKVLEGEGQGILPGHKRTKVVVLMLKEDSDQQEKLTFLQEGLPYKEIQDSNVIKFFSHCVETDPFLMILEYCPTNLKSFMQNNRSSVESFDRGNLILNFACDMARGLQAMHQRDYVHRDFALRNCLVTPDQTVKVGDYGISEELFKEDYYYDSNGNGIPIRWLAPEVMLYSENDVILKRITRNSNLWSYGVTLWELVKFGTLPYADLSNDNVIRLVVKERAVNLSKPDVPISNIEKLYQLMQRCWSEPTLRPSIRELIIMLLHLQTQTNRSSDMLEFDQKWNQLMPRQSFGVFNAPVPSSHSHASSISNGTITTIAYSDGSDVSILPEVVVRPTSFGSEFSELNPSLLAEAGSLQASLRSASETPDSPTTRATLDPTSPINEISLAAELGIAGPSFDEAEDDERGNEEDFDYLSSNSRLTRDQFEAFGTTDVGFAGEKFTVENAKIQHAAEVHKADGDGRRLLEVLGNVSKTFSLDFLSEEEDFGENASSRVKGENAEKSQQEKSPKKMEPGEYLKLFSFDTQELHSSNKNDSDLLFDELLTSTPKVVSDQTEEKFTSPDAEFKSNSVISTASSIYQSAVGNLDDHSFMQPQKYNTHLPTVTASVEGDESKMFGNLGKVSPTVQYQDDDFFGSVEPERETPSAAETADNR